MKGDFDLIVVGGGWAGSIIAAQATSAGLTVLLIERGDTGIASDVDRFHKLRVPGFPTGSLQNTALETFTLRHSHKADAFPLRSLGSFLVGQGLGGSGQLWGGVSPRFHPGSFTPKSLYREGLSQGWAAHIDYRDWPISYDDLEPHYAWVENLLGVASTKGLSSETYRRSRPLPGRDLELNEKNALLMRSAIEAGLDVTEAPLAVSLESYTNDLGVTRSASPIHGYSLATPLNTILPVAVATGKLSIIQGNVRRVTHSNGAATGVVYTQSGTEHMAAGAAVALCGWALNNVKLMLLSAIGKPYDPTTGAGIIGRHYANHIGGAAHGYLPTNLGASPSGQLGGWATSHFDTAPPKDAAYVGGARIHAIGLNSLQRELPSTPASRARWGSAWKNDILPVRRGYWARWGSAWKNDIAEYYGRSIHLGFLGEVAPHRWRYLDLDPTYRDAWGDPLLRITFDWNENDRRMTDRVGQALAEIIQMSGASLANDPRRLADHYDTVSYTNSHATGGVIMGHDPETSAVDPQMRSWDLANLWVTGSSAFPSSPAPNPTPTVCALAHIAALSIVNQLAGAVPVH